MEDLISRIRLIVGKGGSVELEDLTQAIDDTQRNILRKLHVYKWSALFALTFVPLLSAVISILLAEKPYLPSAGESLDLAARWLSYSLTILALLTSLFQPADRFRELCDMGIRVEKIKDDFVTKVQEAEGAGASPKLTEVYNKFEGDLTPIRHRLIGLFLPQVQRNVAERRPQRAAVASARHVARKHAPKAAGSH